VGALAERYNVNPKTVSKWKHRETVANRKTGPKEARSTVLTPEEEAVAVAFRRYALLPLDDCLYGPQPTIPHLTRSSLHHCFQRHSIERLPEVDGDKIPKKKFKAYPIGCFHIDIAEVRTSEGKLHLFVAIDRTSKFAHVELHAKATTVISKQFLDNLVAAVPCAIRTVLTDNGIQFTDSAGQSWTPADIRKMRAEGKLFRCHAFESGCATHNIDHRLTKPKHPWTNG
jgi:transposase InsO family protein